MRFKFKYISLNTLEQFAVKFANKIESLFVKKEEGKNLSSNDFTNKEKEKLAGIENDAQKNTITGVKGNSESTYRTGNINITKTNIGLGNVDNTKDLLKPVSSHQQNALDVQYSQLTAYTNEKISDLIGGAPETLDTLGEIATAMKEHQDVAEALNDAIGSKASATEFDSHESNTTIHTTATEKEKLSTIEDGANKYIHPTSSGNKHIPTGGTSGQILKWTSNGTAKWDENTQALVTDTTDGLMSKEDKIKLDVLNEMSENGNVTGIKGSSESTYRTGNVTIAKADIGLGNVSNVATNNQTPTYTIASTNTALSSGETLTIALGKIAKAISSLISHLADSVSHITTAERTKWNAKQDAITIDNALSSTSTNPLQNKVITESMNGYSQLPISMKEYKFTTSGWYRIAEFKSTSATIIKSAMANAVDIILKTSYGSTTTQYAKVAFIPAYQSSQFALVEKNIRNAPITKFRHVIDDTTGAAYIDAFYSVNVSNTVMFQLCNTEALTKHRWMPITNITKVEETPPIIYSEINITTAKSYGDSTFSEMIPDSVDLNDYKTTGFFHSTSDAKSQTLSNCPTINAFSMIVEETKSDGTIQTIKRHQDGLTYIRVRYAGVWKEWFNSYTENYVQPSVDKLTTARSINGASFNGTANITFGRLYPVSIASGKDLNDYVNSGMYYCPSNATVTTLLNCPTTRAFSLLVERSAGTEQTLTEYSTKTHKGKIWKRAYYNNDWFDWYEVYTEVNPPTPYELGAATNNHLHNTSDISNLEAFIKNIIDSTTISQSHVGMIIQTTNLDTEAKVKTIYGGTKWEKIEGRLLLGQSSSYAINSIGGKTTHTHTNPTTNGTAITIAQMPSHGHSVSITSSGSHNHSVRFYKDAVKTGSGVRWSHSTASGYEQGNNVLISSGNHTHPVNQSNAGSGSAHTHTQGNTGSESSLPPYKVVYIWERTA